VVGWRWGFVVVAGLSLLTATLVALYAPHQPPAKGASPLTELGALKNSQVWLTLGIGAIGFGGMFSVYTYLSTTLLDVTRVSPALAPFVFAVFGIGMTVGLITVPRFAHGNLMQTAGWLLVWSTVMLALYTFAAFNIWTITAAVFAIGLGGALGPVLQTRLMDVAGEAQTLAAALNHSAFNVANALGPLLAGAAIAAGYGVQSSGIVGAALALAGLGVWAVARRA
jgi:DHA1 family inner membrane transport protein